MVVAKGGMPREASPPGQPCTCSVLLALLYLVGSTTSSAISKYIHLPKVDGHADDVDAGYHLQQPHHLGKVMWMMEVWPASTTLPLEV